MSNGTLHLTSKYSEAPGIIYVSDGNPVEASIGKVSGMDALYSLFGWVDGEFEFCSEDVDKKNVINKSNYSHIFYKL